MYTSTIPDLVFSTDKDGNVTYTSGTPPKNTGTTGTEKKWWEQLIGVFPTLVASIFGGQAVQANPVYVATPQPASGNSNTILIIAAAAIVIVLLLSRKK